MSKTINIESFDFPGFSGVESKCSVSLLFPENKENCVIVACTQNKNYTGTSITNGFEIILQKLCKEGLNGIYGEEFKELLAKNIAQESSFFAKLKSLLKSNTNASPNYPELFEKGILIWLEIYPPGTGIVDDRITIQRVYITEDGSPVWSNLLSKEYLEEKIGVKYERIVKNAL
ncbi:hypothetical protein [Methylophaga thalassica]|uniref:hypothetical protein n=1 Tax=Methylophaga aminisulfidivorans TaxID=230105 RepID=UPI000591002D|nr:hypothetical protein [Methylophaga aminisulfidivorans]